ncbi:zinc finger, CCHC-type containing protein [Tanacetum coccineum]
MFLKIKGYIDNLERLGHPVTLGLAVRLILIGLRKEFDRFVQNYNTGIPGETGQNQGNGNISILCCPSPNPPPPKRNIPAKDSICHACGERGHWKRNCPQYLAELLKKKKNTASRAGGGSGSKGKSEILKSGSKLVRGQCRTEAVEAICNFDLSLPSGLCYICMNNCHLMLLLSLEDYFQFPKETIEKLQHDGLKIQLTIRSFEEMRSLYVLEDGKENLTHIKWKAKDLLGLKHSEYVAHLRSLHKVWGCEALVKRDTLTKPDKLEPRISSRIILKIKKASGSPEDL